MKTAAHIPELDGLRGIAILMVVVYHAFLFSVRPPTGWISRLASYGLAGVDLFFVLSGFLITGILLKAKGKSGYFRIFYAKRALRIWPLYYLLLLVSFGLLPLLLFHTHLHMDELALLRSRSVLVYTLLLQNLWYPGGAGPTMLAMTWSLAIEEQFYVVWPWLVLLCSRKKLVWVLIAILILSPLVRIWAILQGVSTDAIHFMTCFRLDGISIGALIALYCKSAYFSLYRTMWISAAALATGVTISQWLLAVHSKVSWSLQYSTLALASAGAVTFAIWCSRTKPLFGRPLRAGPLCYIGQVSYCLYLIHQPIYYALSGTLARKLIGTSSGAAISVMILGFVVSLGIASLSWYLFESQILKLKDRLDSRHQAGPPAMD
jgi:peptidoglycan/LPS O-acetylase OafA/YrhL